MALFALSLSILSISKASSTAQKGAIIREEGKMVFVCPQKEEK